MNYLTLSLVASSKTTTTATSSSSGGSSYFLLVLIVLLVLAYFLWMRPNQRRRMMAARQARAFEVGDEVVAAGMVGRCVGMSDGEVDVEVADGVVLKFVNQAVQSRQAYAASTAGRPGAGRGMGGGGLGGRSFGPTAGASSSQGVSATDGWPEEGARSEPSPGEGGQG
ncbi:MAG: preprotein translocase subunit YajC [Acidimicrobiales bacterium]